MSYTHGKFTWFTVNSTDVARSTAFYTELFGWNTENMDTPDGTYTVLKNNDAGIGGIRATPKKDLPSHWISYLSVPDVDGIAKNIKKDGGAIHMDAFDLPGIGRAAVVADKEGAPFFLFKTTDGDPPDGPGVVGSVHWNELWTNNTASAIEFYKNHLGYTDETMPMGEGEYTILKKDGTPRAGLMKSPKDGIPPMWLNYIQVKDVDITAKRVKDLGGEILGELMTVENVGRFGVAKDSTGAVFGLIAPADKK